MLINTEEKVNEHVVFVLYDGKYPNLCNGTLILEIDGQMVSFGRCGKFSSFWHSGGNCSLYVGANNGEWIIDVSEIPDEYRKYAIEIDEAINLNIPYGCCGGCL